MDWQTIQLPHGGSCALPLGEVGEPRGRPHGIGSIREPLRGGSRHSLPRGAALVAAAVAVLLGLSALGSVEGTIGMCWGQVAWQPMPNVIAVDLLQRLGVEKVKLFNANAAALNAMAGTALEVMVMVRNQDLLEFARDPLAAQGWVDGNVAPFLPAGIDIKYISVGNEPFLANLHTYDDALYDAMKNVADALERSGLDRRVKVTTSFNSEILASPASPPSTGEFNTTWLDQITKIAMLINDTKSIFSVNIYPFYNFRGKDGLKEGFVFFDKAGGATAVKDGALTYTNVFDANLDAIYSALEKIGFPDMDVIIGEIGWPTDGDPVATLALAERFNRQVVHHMYSRVGTPKRPNRTIEGYFFGLFDEDAKGIAAGPFERKWGLYTFDGRPKYALDLSGASEPTAPVAALPAARSVDYLPRKWCVASSAADNSTQKNVEGGVVKICNDTSYDYAGLADCTPLTYNYTTPGLVCAPPGGGDALADPQSASFAFNSYFQVSGQNESVCNFSGAAMIVEQDPSYGSCNFFRGLDLKKMEAFGESSNNFSIVVLGYIVALIVVLGNFL
eukprot:jgi/Mesen1/5472/ME000275S04786